MGSGLNFRSRPLDIDRALPIYEEYELPDLFDACLVNRTVTKVPTGMEKDEECEMDLQKALIAQKNNQKCTKALIPVPEVFLTEVDYTPNKVEIPPGYIGEELVCGIDEASNYDMDGADFKFVNHFTTYVDHFHDNSLFSYDEFESMMELMETTYKSSKSMERVMQLIDKNHINKYVFQHWEKKRKLLEPYYMLVPYVRTHDKNSQNDPFVAFRKRIEKMQTRKNRKLDEVRYTNAFRVLHSLFSATDILVSIDQREIHKRNIEDNSLKLFYKRYNKFSSTNETIANFIVDNPINAVYMNLKSSLSSPPPPPSSNNRKSSSNNAWNIRRVAKNRFWRQMWKSSRQMTSTSRDNKKSKSCCNNLVANDNTTPRYAVQQPKSSTTKILRKLPLYQPEPSVYLLPLRDRHLFKCQSRDEFIRKLYFAHRVKESFAPPTTPKKSLDCLLLLPSVSSISTKIEHLESSIDQHLKKETVEVLSATTNQLHTSCDNDVMTPTTTDELLTNHYQISNDPKSITTSTVVTQINQPLTSFPDNHPSSDSENVLLRSHLLLFDSNSSTAFSSSSNTNDSDETNINQSIVSLVKTENVVVMDVVNGENSGDLSIHQFGFDAQSSSSTEQQIPNTIFLVDQRKSASDDDPPVKRMDSLEQTSIIDDNSPSHISSIQKGDDSCC